MPIDVSVVIPTYNTGPKLEALLASLAGQSLPADRFEIIVVDDGSTDDTWDRLQAAATGMTNLRIERIPNSGWPGRPRNVGTDLARGRYVFYSDHDDEFFPEALERMVDFADRADADLLIGKEVRAGALGVGQELFRADLERADLFEDHVLALMTPHRLFRTSFLLEQGIRFPEGKRRLEDHVLLAEMYTKTDRIAVLSSYPCYRWIIYPDGSNNSTELGDPHLFFDSVADVFDVLDRADISEQLHDDLVRFWFGSRMLKRLTAYWFDGWSDDYRDTVIDVIAKLAAERVPQHLDASLEPMLRRRADLLRKGDYAGIVALAQADHQLHLRIDTSSVEWAEDRLRVEVSGTLVDRYDDPVRFVADAGGLYWYDDHERAQDLTPFLEAAQVDLFLRGRPSGVEWYADQETPFVPRTVDGATVLSVDGSFTVEPATFVFGRPLEPGTWVVFLHARVFGYQSRPHVRDHAPGPAVVGGVPAVATVDNEGRTILRVGTDVPATASSRPSLIRRAVRRAVRR